jgi:hypothetical protein
MASNFKAWLSQRLRGEASAPPAYQAPPRPAAEPYHAVAIVPGLKSCEAARQFGKMRFLSTKAPRLPLPDCHVAECACRYSHFSDRRSGVDRRWRNDWSRDRHAVADVVNRRKSQGRRSTDPVG